MYPIGARALKGGKASSGNDEAWKVASRGENDRDKPAQAEATYKEHERPEREKKHQGCDGSRLFEFQKYSRLGMHRASNPNGHYPKRNEQDKFEHRGA
jgi:hypothetical protein